VRSERSRPGVYTAVPAELPLALHGADAVVAGTVSADEVLRLAGCCRSVTYLTARNERTTALRDRGNVTVVHGAEIVCIDGVDRIESVVVRKIRSGAVSAFNASALFLIGERS
jgi:thioredoxin reductase